MHAMALAMTIMRVKTWRWETLQNTEWGVNKQQWKAVAKQKPCFPFYQNVSWTNGRNVKQAKAHKTNKKVPKGSNELSKGWNQLWRGFNRKNGVA